jgi:hypothetical protein
VDDLLTTLDAVHRDARLLAVVDVSGSMAAPAPGAEGSSRLALALGAAAAGLQLYPDSTEVGLWSFSEDLSGGGNDDPPAGSEARIPRMTPAGAGRV